jgi:hypothetical protein
MQRKLDRTFRDAAGDGREDSGGQPVTVAELRALVATFDWAEWESDLHDAFADDFEAIALGQGTREAAALGVEFAEKDPFLTRFFTRYVGERITQLVGTTKEIVIDEMHDRARRRGRRRADRARRSPALGGR